MGDVVEVGCGRGGDGDVIEVRCGRGGDVVQFTCMLLKWLPRNQRRVLLKRKIKKSLKL